MDVRLTLLIAVVALYAPRVGRSTCKVEAGKSFEWQDQGTPPSVPQDDGRF